MSENEINSAIEQYELALKVNPNNHEILFNLGTA